MKLPITSLFQKKEKTDYYLALLIQEERASGIIIQEDEGKVHVVGQADEYFPQSVEDLPLDKFLDILDKTISKAEEKLPPDVETHKTIFGVKDDWVDEKKIKKEYLTKLKTVCDELKLTPTGFLVTSEAITHLLQEEEGAPITAILVELGKKFINVSLLRAGRTLETKTSLVVDHPVTVVDGLLKHFTADVFPTRVILYGEVNEQTAQEFITHQWSKSLSFLHVPQVSLLPKDFDSKAVIYGAATQLGFDLEGTTLEKTKEDIKTLDPKEIIAKGSTPPIVENVSSVPQELESEEAIADETMPTDVDPTPDSSGDETFGFVMDKDISTEPGEEKSVKQQAIETDEETDSITQTDDSHYKIHHYSDEVVPVDDFASALHGRDEREKKSDDESFENDEEPMQEVNEKRNSRRFNSTALLGFLKIPLSFLRRITTAASGNSRLALFITPLVIILLVGLIVLYIFNVQAVVTLTVNPKLIEQDTALTFSLSGTNDYGNSTVAAKKIDTTIDGTVSTEATGQKDTGTPAKGTVILYSRLTQNKTVASGTTIKSSNGLSFTLDKDVNLASASGDASSAPTTATVTVTASTVGKESNLPSGTKFSVADFSADDLVAKNENAFSGGTKKTVSAVAKSDIDKLLLDLPKSLEEKAKGQLSQQVSGDETLLAGFINESVTKKNIDKNVGDEAKTVTLKGTVSFTTASYKNADLLSYAKQLIQDKYLQDQQLSDGSITTTIGGINPQSSDSVQAKAHIKAGLLPKIDNAKIVDTITGKSIIDAKSALAQLPQIQAVSIRLSPNIPFLSTKLPRFKDHIHITVQTHE